MKLLMASNIQLNYVISDRILLYSKYCSGNKGQCHIYPGEIISLEKVEVSFKLAASPQIETAMQ